MQNLPTTQPQQPTGFALSTVNTHEIASELEGLGSISLDIVKIPSGGGVMFELPGDNPDNPEVVKDITGVVVDHHPVNSYWASEYTGGNSAPDCMSLDGKIGRVLATGEEHNCADCPMNQFKTRGVGKACKNSHRLYILREGDALPLILAVPPSSLKALKEYLAKRVLLKGRKLSNVITSVTLKKAQSSGGITYSQVQFAKVGELAPDQEAAIKPMTDLMKVIGRRYPEPETDDEQQLGGAPAGQQPAPQPQYTQQQPQYQAHAQQPQQQPYQRYIRPAPSMQPQPVRNNNGLQWIPQQAQDDEDLPFEHAEELPM